ncbi:Uncharacterised protein [Mycobacteroides abscessus subsp. abscessus]|nr:Uncharacterised protein [Mycobacteroides abscessus subsp. abscessus]
MSIVESHLQAVADELGLYTAVGRQQFADRGLVVAGDGRGETLGGGEELVVRDHLGHQACPQRILGGEVVAGQAHPPGQAPPHRERQQGGQPPGRQDANARMGVGESCLLRGDENVAGQCQLQTAGHRSAVDGADDRLAQFGPPRVQGLGTIATAQLLEVHARAEDRVGRGQDHHVDVLVGVGRGDGLDDLLAQGGAQGVTCLRPIQGDGADAVFGVGQQNWFGHASITSLAIRSAWTARPPKRAELLTARL